MAVPIGFDFPETVPALVRGYGKDFGNWETYVPLMGSSLLFKLDTDPVTDCGRVALPSAVGILANLSALVSAGPLAHLITRELTASSDQVANPIVQVSDDATYTITNYTQKGHIFYPGKIVRIVVEECGRVKIITIGAGTHFFGNSGAGGYMAGLNERAGKILFNNADQRIIEAYKKLPK